MDPLNRERTAAGFATFRVTAAVAIVLFIALVTARPLMTQADDGYRMFVPLVPDDLSPGLTHSLRRTALVFIEVEPGEFAVGSAFVLQDGIVVTAAHVVSSAPDLPITVFCNGEETPGHRVLIDEERDIAIIAAFCAEGPIPIRYALGPPDADLPLVMSGFTFVSEGTDDGTAAMIAVQYAQPTSFIPGADLTRFITRENMDSSVRRVVDGMTSVKAAPLLAVAGSMKQGHSGSAVYDFTGALVGMAIIIDVARNRSFIVPAESILLDVIAATRP